MFTSTCVVGEYIGADGLSLLLRGGATGDDDAAAAAAAQGAEDEAAELLLDANGGDSEAREGRATQQASRAPLWLTLAHAASRAQVAAPVQAGGGGGPSTGAPKRGSLLSFWGRPAPQPSAHEQAEAAVRAARRAATEAAERRRAGRSNTVHSFLKTRLNFFV